MRTDSGVAPLVCVRGDLTAWQLCVRALHERPHETLCPPQTVECEGAHLGAAANAAGESYQAVAASLLATVQPRCLVVAAGRLIGLRFPRLDDARVRPIEHAVAIVGTEVAESERV